jgi:RecB family exonuclease
LQKKRVASDMSVWEEEERKKAAEELQQMELEAEIQAEVERQQVRGTCSSRAFCLHALSLIAGGTFACKGTCTAADMPHHHVYAAN